MQSVIFNRRNVCSIKALYIYRQNLKTYININSNVVHNMKTWDENCYERSIIFYLFCLAKNIVPRKIDSFLLCDTKMTYV